MSLPFYLFRKRNILSKFTSECKGSSQQYNLNINRRRFLNLPVKGIVQHNFSPEKISFVI